MKTIDSLLEELTERDVQMEQLGARVSQLETALRLHMAHFEWKYSADVEEVLQDSYDRWNYLVGLTEKALGLPKQERWRL